MWVPGEMAALVGGGLVGGSSWLCKSLMDAKGPLWLERQEWRECGGTKVLSDQG